MKGLAIVFVCLLIFSLSALAQTATIRELVRNAAF